MASREKELSALPQTSDPPRGRLSGLVEGPSGYRLFHGHHCMHRLQGVRGGLQAVEPTTLRWL